MFQPPSIVARLFFGLDGIHTDSRGARGNLCCGHHCWPFRPSFQACFTYRPTPICLDDRAKPASKGWLFLTDFEPTQEATLLDVLQGEVDQPKGQSLGGWLYRDISRWSTENAAFPIVIHASQCWRGGDSTVPDTRRPRSKKSLPFVEEISSLLNSLLCGRISIRGY